MALKIQDTLRSLDTISFKKTRPKLYDKLCRICGKAFVAKRKHAELCGRWQCRKLSADEEKLKAVKRAGGICEVCKTPSKKLVFREDVMMCGTCTTVRSKEKFYMRVGDPESTKYVLWSRVLRALDDIPKKTKGIVSLKNLPEDKEYLIPTINSLKESRLHLEKLSEGSHTNKLLQEDWNRLGRFNFKFSLIKEIQDRNLLPYFFLQACTERKPYYNQADEKLS